MVAVLPSSSGFCGPLNTAPLGRIRWSKSVGELGHVSGKLCFELILRRYKLDGGVYFVSPDDG